MIRDFHLADFLTLCNAACGMAGIFLAMVFVTSGALADFLWAAAMAPLAFAFDWLDGRVARYQRGADGRACRHCVATRPCRAVAGRGLGPVRMGIASVDADVRAVRQLDDQ